MKFPLHGIALALAASSSLLAEVQPWAMPSPLPTPGIGDTVSTVPAPRIDWLVRAGKKIEGARENPDSIQVVFDGDSITDFWQRDGEMGGKAIWDARYTKYGAYDFGIAGDRTEHLLWRLSQGQAEGLRPKLILLMIGTNNLAAGHSPEIVARGVKAILDAYRQRCPDAVILLQAIFPRGESPADPHRKAIAETNEIIKGFADGKHILYVDFGDKFLAPDGTLPREIMPDFLHPGPKGYEIWAEAIAPFIEKYAGK